MTVLDSSDKYIGDKHFVAVDCIVFGFDSGQLKLLLFKRRVNPLKGHWSLVGSFINSSMNCDDSAQQILTKSTGLSNIYLKELRIYSNIDRNPDTRIISVAYYSLIRIDEFNLESVEKYDAHWFDFDDIPELIADHGEMIKDAITRLRLKARYEPIGFNLLPKKFTIQQLQQLYESIYQKKLDVGNFRKKILSFGILTKTQEKDKSGSKKGAFLYKFNKKKFDNFIANGYNFKL